VPKDSAATQRDKTAAEEQTNLANPNPKVSAPVDNYMMAARAI
jgi:hypothetical protein